MPHSRARRRIDRPPGCQGFHPSTLPPAHAGYGRVPCGPAGLISFFCPILLQQIRRQGRRGLPQFFRRCVALRFPKKSVPPLASRVPRSLTPLCNRVADLRHQRRRLHYDN
ncbi:hypothetical protein RHECIAT_PC0000889 (plasmid) [Rhizobium etli CIAT 652]|uniref:Uncharacterized protein n=1 Tax=Rhizobium etli (strain CIAT 652) TaxID=491916 RepID=B3Q3U9_RHIE6|nr:hypothetical protein RHECIAT_PC0000889 [Rhizobium etli CIAT 652]